jgi:hypothetical protein
VLVEEMILYPLGESEYVATCALADFWRLPNEIAMSFPRKIEGFYPTLDMWSFSMRKIDKDYRAEPYTNELNGRLPGGSDDIFEFLAFGA